jgi:hypothetical protein
MISKTIAIIGAGAYLIVKNIWVEFGLQIKHISIYELRA